MFITDLYQFSFSDDCLKTISIDFFMPEHPVSKYCWHIVLYQIYFGCHTVWTGWFTLFPGNEIFSRRTWTSDFVRMVHPSPYEICSQITWTSDWGGIVYFPPPLPPTEIQVVLTENRFASFFLFSLSDSTLNPMYEIPRYHFRVRAPTITFAFW